ncbi:alkaline phosphatase family protein [Streptomyces sp. TRM64462]|uniref:alkaline phosphatase family protein n=1 Tax=Streptomyces sp. TRM64462 TaxID=2741726 RepID=UPI001C2F8F2A|nr:alkaline phosphatase family protein [Streptomyces sp. TRM64462]
MTVYWVVWDAGAHWVVDRLEREGALPAVTRMRTSGTLAAARPPRPNCQTPPSLATLFTGAPPARHGVTGFTVPYGGPGSADHVSGFDARFPAVPTVWERLGERGLRGAFVHVPWVFGADDLPGGYADAAVEAYSRRIVRHAVYEVPAGPGTRVWDIGGYAVEVTRQEPDAVRLDSGRARVRQSAGEEWRPLDLGGGHGTWVGCVRVDGRLLLVHTGVWRTRIGGSDPATVERLTRCPPFAGEGVGPLYRQGVFGPRLADGGDGTAEEVFLTSVECVARGFTAAADAVLDTHDADLVIVYLPMTDDVGHELLGWCDPRSGAHRPDVEQAVWAHVRRCYQWSDTVLGRVLDRAGPEDTVVLGADHGMVGSTHLVHLNDALVRCGLARRTADGALDPERSQVFYHPANNGALWPGGAHAGDPPRARRAMERAVAALRGLTDDATGLPVVAAFLEPDGPVPDMDTATAPVHVALVDDYQPTAALAGDGGPVVRPTPKTGAHVVNTGDSRLHAVHAAVGPGIAPGVRGGVVDNTEPAALVLRHLGLDHSPTTPLHTP